jgi:general secretion pathway protein K
VNPHWLINNRGRADMQKNIRQKGIALVMVLWILALLTVMATGYSHAMRTEIKLTTNLLHSAQSKAVAEAGIWYAVAELLKPQREQAWKSDGSIYTLDFSQDTIKVSIQDEAGKIDLNTAPSEILDGLLRAVNVPEEERLSILQSILDWRDRDNLVRSGGAEDDDYELLDYDYGAKDGPFNTVDELQLVMGVTPSLFKKLKPALTIHSHQPGIRPQVASKEALLAFPGITQEHVAEIIAKRNALSGPNSRIPVTGLDSKYLSRNKGFIFTITSEGIHGGSSALIDVVVMVLRNTNLGMPYLIMSWQEDQSHD